MTTTSAPFGLSFFDRIGGKDRGQSNVYPLAVQNVSLGNGDPVSPADGGGSIGTGVGPGLVTNGSTAATAQVAGVFQGVTYINAQGAVIVAPYWAASTPVFAGTIPYANVNDDPYAEFLIQCNATLTRSVIHKNYDFVAPATATPNAQTGLSRVPLGVSTYATAIRALRVTGLAPWATAPNDWNDPFPIVKVVINNHAFRAPQLGL